MRDCQDLQAVLLFAPPTDTRMHLLLEPDGGKAAADESYGARRLTHFEIQVLTGTTQ